MWPTLAFALLDRSDAAASSRERSPVLGQVYASVGESLQDVDGLAWTPDQLPEIDPSRHEVVGEQVISAVFLVLVGAALVWQHLSPPVTDASGRPVPVLDPDAWAGWLGVLLALIVVELGFAAVLAVRRWTLTLVVVNATLGAAGIAVAAWAVTSGVLNPAFPTAVGWDLDASVYDTAATFGLIVVVGIALWDAIDGARRWRRTTRSTTGHA